MCPLLAAALVQTTLQATETATVSPQQLAPISLYANCQDALTSSGMIQLQLYYHEENCHRLHLGHTNKGTAAARLRGLDVLC